MLLFNFVPSRETSPCDNFRMDSSTVLAGPNMSPRLMSPCMASTSFATSAVMDLNHQLANSFLASLQTPFIRQPPPYTTRINPSHATHQALLQMHKTHVISEQDPELDILDPAVGSSTSDTVTPSQKSPTEVDEVQQDDQPLDLSLKNTSRPTVIIEKCDRPIHRSASNASTLVPDVHEHFRRSLSGKWPKRSKTEDGGRGEPSSCRSSPFRRHTSFNTHCSVQVNQTKGVEIEDHFRRALGGEEYEAWKRKRAAKDSNK